MGTETAPAERRRMMRFNPQGAKVKAYRVGTVLGLFGSGKDDLGGDVLDVSGLGLRFISTQKLVLNSRLKIVLSYKSDGPLTCTAIVKWAHPHTVADRYVVGVEFERLTDAQVELLDKMQKSATSK